MTKQNVQDVLNSLSKAKSELERQLVVMQKEITGFCAGTGKIAEINSIGKAVSSEFDFEKMMGKFELRFANMKRAEVLAKEELDSFVQLSPTILEETERKIASIRSVQEQQSLIVKEIKIHNEISKKFKITKKTIVSIKNAGWWSRKFSSDFKRAKKILSEIDDRYEVNYNQFLMMIDNAKRCVVEFEKDMHVKKRMMEPHDEAVDEYRAKKSAVKEFSIHQDFSNLLSKAFNNKIFIQAFVMMSGDQGKTVVDAVFKYRLLRTMYVDCVDGINELNDSPYSLDNSHNAGVMLNKITKMLHGYESVYSSNVRFRFNEERNFDEMYKRYLREVSNEAGTQVSSYKDKEFSLDGGVVFKVDAMTFNANSQSNLEIEHKNESIPKNKGIFSSLLNRGNKKADKKALLVG